MPGIEVRFRALSSKALRLEMTSIHRQIEDFIYDTLADIRDNVRPYPPVPAPRGTRRRVPYQRTYTLYNGWHIGTGQFSRTMLIDTSAHPDGRGRQYAQFVHGDTTGQWQQWYHAENGWRLLADYIDRDSFRSGVQQLYRSARIK